MPNKPLLGLTASPRRSKARTSTQRKAKSRAQIRDERIKNLEKARRAKKKKLTAEKKARKK